MSADWCGDRKSGKNFEGNGIEDKGNLADWHRLISSLVTKCRLSLDGLNHALVCVSRASHCVHYYFGCLLNTYSGFGAILHSEKNQHGRVFFTFYYAT